MDEVADESVFVSAGLSELPPQAAAKMVQPTINATLLFIIIDVWFQRKA